MNRAAYTEAQLIADLRATFPGLPANPLADLAYADMDCGICTSADSNAAFADGEPLFISSSQHADGYDGGVHEGFTEWLQSRGWYVESYDGAVMFILPIEVVPCLAGEWK